MRTKFSVIISIALVNLFNYHAYAEPPMNLTSAKFAVVDYYESGSFDNDVRESVYEATQYLQKRIIENNNSLTPQKLAIVLDIDDTSLSNYPKYRTKDFAHTHEVIVNGFQDANAPAIKPILELYNIAIKNGVETFFITGRPETVRSVTEKNLHQAGFFNWTNLYLISDQDKQKPAENFKATMRQALTKAGYQIVLNIGDQDSDFIGDYAERMVKIPNPLYSLTEELNRSDGRQ